MKWKTTLVIIFCNLGILFAQTNEQATFAVFNPIEENDTVMIACGQVLSGMGGELVEHGYYPLQSTLLSIPIQEYNDDLFQVFPNPFSDHIIVDASGGADPIVQVTMTDVTGAIVLDTFVENESIQLSTESLSSGLYTIHVWSEKNEMIQSYKLIKP